MSDSSTGGFLTPDGALPAPLEDDALDNLLQEMVVGITGLDPTLVSPRWQPEMPLIPSNGTDWAAIGVVHRVGDAFAYEVHLPNANAGAGADQVTRHERLDLLVSFYGPNCQANGARLRDGLQLSQNRDTLAAQNMALVSVGDLTKAPELIKNTWVPRCDLTVVIARAVTREYSILHIVAADGTIVTDDTPPLSIAFKTSGS